MNSKQKELIRATVPILREHGVALTTHFYQRMFTHNLELKHIFNQGNQHKGHQQTALDMTVLAYAENIDNSAALTTPLSRIGHKHRSMVLRYCAKRLGSTPLPRFYT